MKNLIKNNLKRKIWLTGCVTLLFVLVRPMMQLMKYENEKRYALTHESLVSNMESFFLPDVFSDYLPTAIVCIVVAIMFFGYLFSKKQVDLYHSIPVDRKHLFKMNYLSGVIVYIIALFVQNVVSILIAISNNYMTLKSWKYMFIALCINVVHFLFGYVIVICGIMLAGNIPVAIAASAVLALIYPLCVTLYNYLQGYFYVTYTSNNVIKLTLLEKYYWLSPITSYATLIERTTYDWDNFHYDNPLEALVELILPVIMTILFTGISYYLYKKRPSEAAGRAISFKKARAFFEVPITILGGILGVWFMTTSINTYKTSWIWTGLILGVLLVHCILEVIINESFKAILSHKIQLIGSLAVTALIISIFYFDVTNYDNYVPDNNKVLSASVYFDNIDTDLSTMEVSENLENKGTYNVEYLMGETYAFSHRFTDADLINYIINISEIGVTCVDDMIAEKYENNDSAYYNKYATEEKIVLADSEENFLNGLSEDEAYQQALSWMQENGIHILEKNDIRKLYVRVCYELNNGKIVLRSYEIPLSKIKEAMNDVYKSEEFKKVHFNLFAEFEKDVINKVEVFDGFDNKVVSVTEEEKDRLLKTYLSELKKIDINTISDIPIGRIVPHIKVSELYDDTFTGYFIYPEFSETLSLIESYGVDTEAFTNNIKSDDIMSVSISSYNLYGYNENETLFLDNLSYNIESDKKFIKELSPMIINANYAWSNNMLISEKTNMDIIGIDISTNLKPVKGIQRYFTVIFKDGKIPEKVMKDIVIEMWKENK